LSPIRCTPAPGFGCFFAVLSQLGGHLSNAQTATLECERYIDALQFTIGDIVSPLWLGVILVAANPRRVLPP
jgi:hypothetical protein